MTAGPRSVAIALLALLSGCVTFTQPDARGAGASPGHDYALAFLTTGERAAELDDAAVTNAAMGHRAHIERLGAEGTLLLAGPFGEPRADESWRGIYVFGLSDMAAAQDLARADPSIQAGLFDVTIVPWQSDVDLRPLRDELEQDKANGAPFVPAAYVLAIGPAPEQVQDLLFELRAQGRLICAGALGGQREGEWLLLLAAESVDQAQEWLDAGTAAPGWELSSLWATALLGDLAQAQTEPPSGAPSP